MLEVVPPTPIKVFAGLLLAESAPVERVIEELELHWGRSDWRSDFFSFDCTDYYTEEMGPGVRRMFVSFAELLEPDQLAWLKLDGNEVEAQFLDGTGRLANIDVGYLDVHKVVLASTKEGPCKIYVGKGIWADMTLRYSKGTFHSFPWTFIDFAEGRYDRVLLTIREQYKRQLRELRKGAE